MGWVELTEGPDGLRTRGAQFSGSAEDFAAKLAACQAKIAALEAAKPWGGDQYGQEFEKQYFKGTEDGPYSQAVDAMARSLGPEASDLGIALTTGAADYDAEDEHARNDISRLV